MEFTSRISQARFTSWIFDSPMNIILGVNSGVHGSFHLYPEFHAVSDLKDFL